MKIEEEMFFDLHCDLLLYLAHHPYNSAYDEASRVSISQLLEGQVETQTMAIYSPTDSLSVQRGIKQAKIYKTLSDRYEEYGRQIHTHLAIENSSSFCGEDEPLDQGIKRLEWISKTIEKPLYVSLTWHTENRFGGGNHTKVGLKEDGKKLLERMQGLSYAIDFSHTSDALAHDILEFIDREKLAYKLVASHSNFRKKQNIARNLPDEIADEIVARKGLIGLGIIRSFLGDSIENLIEHVAYGLERGYEDHLAFGADFFSEKAIPKSWRTKNESYYFDGFDTASCYPRLFELLSRAFDRAITEKIASKNAKRFIRQLSSVQMQ